MTSANRTRISFCEEARLGETPPSPRMRILRLTGESLQVAPKFVTSEELRADRMNADPIKINEENQGSVNFELSFPAPETSLDRLLAGAMFEEWQNQPFRDNDGIAGGRILTVDGAGKKIDIAAGPAFVPGQLVRLSGFARPVNNGLRPLLFASPDSLSLGGEPMADEPLAGASARLKAVGFAGEAGDIKATVNGLSSATLDFSKLGLRPYSFIKLGGTALGNRFTAGANNGFARITGIAPHELTLDHLPPGWLADEGRDKQIYVWVSDLLRNGVAKRSFTIERSFFGQRIPAHIRQCGMVVGQCDIAYDTEAVIKGSFQLMGMRGGVDTREPLDPMPDPASTARYMSANVHVGNITEGGGPVIGPNWVRSAKININNNLRTLTAVGNLGAVDISEGDCSIGFTLETYFGSAEQFQKMLAGEVGSLFLPAVIDRQAICFHAPRVTLTGGSPSAGGKNQDVMLPLTAQAAVHAESNSQAQFERFEYLE